MMSGVNSSSGYSNIYMNQQKSQAPKIDTNNDSAADLQELESFSAKQAEKTGTTFDAKEVMTKYDTNSDGLIDQSEGTTLQEENGLNLPSPEELQAQMMAGGGNKPVSPPSGGKGGGQGGGNASSGVTDSTSQTVDALLEALETDETDITSTDTSDAELLETLTTSTTTYTAAEIAEYDTNGDGTIDTAEEALMKLAQAEALETSQDSQVKPQAGGNDFSKLMQQAITAYTQNNQSDTASQFKEVVA